MEVPSVNFSKILGLNVAKPGQAPPTEAESAPQVEQTNATADSVPVADAQADPPAVTADSAKVVDSQADQATVTADQTVAPAVKQDVDSTVTEEVAPKVEHETVTKEHEEKEKTVIDKERHQDHYHTSVVRAQDTEVLPEEHRYEDTATEVKEIDHDDGAAKQANDARKAEFKDTREEGMTAEKKTKEADEVGSEEVHHHLHETIQPVVEKTTIQPVTTHKTIHVKELHQDASVDEGTTEEAPVSVEELENKVGRVTGEERY